LPDHLLGGTLVFDEKLIQGGIESIRGITMGKVSVMALLAFSPIAWAALAGQAAAQSAGELVVQASLPRAGYSMAFGFDGLWMMSDDRLVRVDTLDDRIIEIEISPGSDENLLAGADQYRGIAVGEGAVWLPDTGSSTIYKIDPHTNQVLMKIPTDIFGSRGSIGVGEGAVWVITFADHDKTLTRYDAASGTEEARIALPAASKGVLVDYGSVWVTAASRGELYRIDPKTNQVAATIALHDTSHLLASGYGSIWIPFGTSGIVQRIDGQTGELLATIGTGAVDMESDGDIATGGGFVWTINRGSTVARIDPDSNAVKGLFRPPSGTLMGRRIRYGAGSLWVSGGSIFRISPPE
jgi:virginiamycin B lyase